MRMIAKLVALALLPISSAFASESHTVVMDLQKVQCYACMYTVQKALQKVPGVEGAQINLEKKTATVQFDPTKTNTEALVKATTGAGFPSTVRK